MKTAQIKELRDRLSGFITDAADVREHFATDGGVLAVTPAAVVYPRTISDVRTIVRYAAEAAQAGKPIELTARGGGNSQTGASLGEGAVVVFPAHLNRVRHLAKNSVTVQPGITVGTLQQVLHGHGRRLPLPPTYDACTVGGLVATNAAGELSGKYGAAGDWVESLRAILDDGSEIETRRIGKRELGRKKGLMTREGDLYRGIDGLLQDHKAVIGASSPKTSRNAAGYRLSAIKRRDGSFDLSQLIIGAEGTLGLILEVTLKTVPVPDRTTLVVGSFDDLEKAAEAVARLQSLGPSALELADHHLLGQLRTHHPAVLEHLQTGSNTKAVVWAEFDSPSHLRQNIAGRRAERILSKLGASRTLTTDHAAQERLWAARRLAAATLWTHAGAKKPLPLISDVGVPMDKLAEFLEEAPKILQKRKLDLALWGHGGDATISLWPLLDLTKPKGRKTAITVMDDVFNLVIMLGGTIAAGQGDGRLKTPYLEKQFGHEMFQLFKDTKQICDPQGIFNSQVKTGVKKKDLEQWLRHEYRRHHQYDHLSRL